MSEKDASLVWQDGAISKHLERVDGENWFVLKVHGYTVFRSRSSYEVSMKADEIRRRWENVAFVDASEIED